MDNYGGGLLLLETGGNLDGPQSCCIERLVSVNDSGSLPYL